MKAATREPHSSSSREQSSVWMIASMKHSLHSSTWHCQFNTFFGASDIVPIHMAAARSCSGRERSHLSAFSVVAVCMAASSSSSVFTCQAMHLDSVKRWHTEVPSTERCTCSSHSPARRLQPTRTAQDWSLPLSIDSMSLT